MAKPLTDAQVHEFSLRMAELIKGKNINEVVAMAITLIRTSMEQEPGMAQEIVMWVVDALDETIAEIERDDGNGNGGTTTN